MNERDWGPAHRVLTTVDLVVLWSVGIVLSGVLGFLGWAVS